MSRQFRYMQVRDKILNDAVMAGERRLPSEHEICSLYQVSRTTAIKALNSLAHEDLVRREVGRGTFLNTANVNVPVRILVDGAFPDLPAFFSEIAARYRENEPLVRVEVLPVQQRDWIRQIATRSGAKIIITSHVGYLASMGLLEPLNQLPLFAEVAGGLRSEYIEWHSVRGTGPACYALPFSLDTMIFCYNRQIAAALGLDAERGPSSQADLVVWMQAARKAGRLGGLLRKVAPLSEYLCLSAGRHFFREENQRFLMDLEHVEAWIQLFRDLFCIGALRLEHDDEVDPIVTGEALMGFHIGSWILHQAEEHGVLDQLVLRAPPPAIPGRPSFCNIGTSEVALACGESLERERQASLRLMRYLLLSPEVHRRLLDYRSSISANRIVYEEQQADPRWTPFIQGLSMGRMRCDHPAQHRLLHIVRKFFFESVAGDRSPRDAARRIREACELQLDVEGERTATAHEPIELAERDS